MNQVAGVSLISAGQMMGVYVGISAVWNLLTARTSDCVREKCVLTTTQVRLILSSL